MIGAWLLGVLLTSFVVGQSRLNVERFFSNPPPQLPKQLDGSEPESLRQVLAFQAAQHNRHVRETWEMIQLGTLGALLATSIFTAHRSRILLSSSLLMFVMVLVAYFYLTPMMNVLSRSYDFLPPESGLHERETYNSYWVWYRVLDIFKVILALIITGRLLLDRYEWQDKLTFDNSPKTAARHRPHSVGSAANSTATRVTNGVQSTASSVETE